MATEKLTINVDKKVMQDIATAFGVEDARKQEILEKVAVQALLEWHAWLSGERRYLSLTEQQIDRVASLYESLLPGERPSAPDISHRFSVPDGAAAYISRVLSERKFTHWRKQGLLELRELIQTKSKDAQERIQKREGDKLTSIRLTRIAVRELERCLDELARKDNSLTLPRRGATSGDQVELSIQWNTIDLLVKHPDLSSVA